ncbi:MAG: N-acetyl-gamma-glutamyl-phosphate reductase [Planctomycetes bacterium]|nr:N-acetyl-gamma-glutamyl-phosphate reductase [Planctomycetota bacterium]
MTSRSTSGTTAATKRRSVVVLGASGYTGRELLRLLARHPSLELSGFLGAREGVAPDAPALPVDAPVAPLDWKAVERADGVFLCTPHAASAVLAMRCLELGKPVVDLSADFRLRDPALYQRVYEHVHPAPQLLGEAVYGLTEFARERVGGARLVANPGCYPTSVQLALKPLLEAGLLDREHVIVADCKSGASGAGKNPSERTVYGNVHENFLAYGVGTHRHAPEIQQELCTERLVFVPHLLPVFRGILSTLYVRPVAGRGAGDLRACLAERYARERFVKVFAKGQPELNRVQMTNECHIAVADAGELVVITSAIDNLVKGASGQALQNMNLMLGCAEHEGLA